MVLKIAQGLAANAPAAATAKSGPNSPAVMPDGRGVWATQLNAVGSSQKAYEVYRYPKARISGDYQLSAAAASTYYTGTPGNWQRYTAAGATAAGGGSGSGGGVVASRNVAAKSGVGLAARAPSYGLGGGSWSADAGPVGKRGPRPAPKPERPAKSGHMANAEAAGRLIACPDEIVASSNMPTLPTSNTSPRYSHVATYVGDVSLGNYNLEVECPGQTCWAATNIGTGLAAGSLVMLNMGDPSLMFSLQDVGLSALPATTNVTTARIVPRAHRGYRMRCDTAKPGPPVPIEFSESGASGIAAYWPVYDSLGNYALLIFPAPKQVAAVLIGDVLLASTTTASSTTVPFTNSSFSQNGVSMTVTPKLLQTGIPVRRLFQFDGPVIDDPRDLQAYANLPVASSTSLTNLGSALDRQFNVVSYGVPTGGDSIYAQRAQMSDVNRYATVAPSWETLNTCMRNRTQVPFSVTNDDYYKIKVASRLATADFKAPLICAWEAADTELPDVQMPGNPVQFPQFRSPTFNSQAAGWIRNTISFTLICNGSSTAGATYPASETGVVWFEAQVPADVGLVVKMPMYCATFVNWLQVIASYPVLARAHSFKDWLKTAWTAAKGVIKDAGREIAVFAGAVFRDAAVEALITGAGVLAAL